MVSTPNRAIPLDKISPFHVSLLTVLAAVLLLRCESSTTEPDPHDHLAGYYLDETSLWEEMPWTLADSSGAFTYSISRSFYPWSDHQRRSLEKTESLFPPPDSILIHGDMQPSDIPGDESLWWYTQFDSVRIPYAIPWAAVQYYLDLLELYEQGIFPGAGSRENRTAALSYEASVDHYDDFHISAGSYGQVTVVTQRLQWTSYCGYMCSLMFTVERQVILDYETEEVLAILGDGPTGFIVS